MSLQIEHKTEKGTVLFVMVAPDASNFRISKGFPDPPKGDLAYDTKENVWQTGDVIIPIGFKFIGLTSEVTEEQLACVFDEVVAIQSWDDYSDSPNVDKISRIEQLNSIIEDLGIKHPSLVLFKPND